MSTRNIELKKLGDVIRSVFPNNALWSFEDVTELKNRYPGLFYVPLSKPYQIANLSDEINRGLWTWDMLAKTRSEKRKDNLANRLCGSYTWQEVYDIYLKEKMTYQEIANMAGVSRQHVHYCIRQMRKMKIIKQEISL